MPEPGEPRRTMGPWKKSLPLTVGHKNETVPKILVNVLIAFRGGFRIKWPIYAFAEVHYLSTALLIAGMHPV